MAGSPPVLELAKRLVAVDQRATGLDQSGDAPQYTEQNDYCDRVHLYNLLTTFRELSASMDNLQGSL
jgi:hypothetical protein